MNWDRIQDRWLQLKGKPTEPKKKTTEKAPAPK